MFYICSPNESVLHRQSEFFVHIISRTDRFARNCFENVYNVLCHVMLRRVVSRHVTSRHVLSRRVASRRVLYSSSVRVSLYACITLFMLSV